MFLCGWYPSRVLPTNGNFIHRHATAVALQHKVTCIHIITDPNIDAAVEIVTDDTTTVTSHIAYVKKTKNPLLKVWFFFRAFRLLLQKIPFYDIVHLHQIFPFGWLALYLKWFRKKKYIISEHWTDYKYPFSKKISFTHKISAKIIAKNSAFICPVTKDLQNSLKTFGVHGKYAVVPNVVDTELFSPQKQVPEIFRLVHISNMDDAHKNITGLIKAIAKIQDQFANFELLCIGKNATKYKTIAKELQLSSVTFIEHIPHKELVVHLQKASVFLLFSNYENLPCVILEAFSCGIPVISSDVGGIHEFFLENFGRLIPAKDEKKLQDEILHFYFQKHTLASKEEMHNYVVSNFSKEKICNQFTQLYYTTIR